MARGVAGYGRYDDDPQHVGCPWAKSDMTPCVARDGHLALAGVTGARVQCVGCGNYLAFLYRDLADDYGPAAGLPPVPDQDADADRFRDLVRQATEPQEGGG
jgi:hypothetical protein